MLSNSSVACFRIALTNAQRDALILEFAGETLPLADTHLLHKPRYQGYWDATWLTTNAPSLTYDPTTDHAPRRRHGQRLPAHLGPGLSGRDYPPTLSTDATLSALALQDASDNSAITLSPGFSSSTTSYTASEANDVDEITVLPTVNESNATYEIQDGDGTALVDANSQTGFQVDLSEGDNTVKVEVTAEDTTTETYTVVVTRERRVTTTPAAPPEVTVPNDWSLIPSGLVARATSSGSSFSPPRRPTPRPTTSRTTTTSSRVAPMWATPTSRPTATGFRAVGCTADSDARDNTATTGTGVRIHWLNGNRVADNYGDFKDGSWDEERNNQDRNELGNSVGDSYALGSSVRPRYIQHQQPPLHGLQARRHGVYYWNYFVRARRARRVCAHGSSQLHRQRRRPPQQQ